METNKLEIARTIQQQLGHQCLCMLGAQYLAGGPDYLSFRFGGSTKANHLKITLQANDTYTMEFTRIRGIDCKKIAEYQNIYCDQLREIIRKTTGLNTNL